MALSTQETEKFKSLLIEQKAKFLNELKTFEKNPDYGSDIDHLEEETDETEDFANRLSVETSVRSELETVENALGRITKGTYGVCTQCGKHIEREVLHAHPASELCKRCKASKQ